MDEQLNEPEALARNRLRWRYLEPGFPGPFYFGLLNEEQRHIIREWFADTAKHSMTGETTEAAFGLLAGLILGNRIDRIVQCGHYAGLSLLVLGMLLKNNVPGGRVVSLDIDQQITRYARGWVERAGLGEIVHTLIIDSGDPIAAQLAEHELGGAPGLVYIDSSHLYRRTLEELDLWSRAVAPGGFICMHDAAKCMAAVDFTGGGGVSAALAEWLPCHPEVNAAVIDPEPAKGNLLPPVYRDPCGFALLQLAARPPRPREHPVEVSITRRRIVADPDFRHSGSWQLGEGWEWSPGGLRKSPGTSSPAACFSPVVAGERYRVKVELADVIAGGVYPAVGAGGLFDYLTINGEHECTILAGAGNAEIGLLPSSDFAGRVLRFDAAVVIEPS